MSEMDIFPQRVSGWGKGGMVFLWFLRAGNLPQQQGRPGSMVGCGNSVMAS